MPRIPIPEYQQSVLPSSTGITPHAQGTNFESSAPGLAAPGQVLTDFAAKFQEEQNVTAVNDAYANKFSPAYRQIYGSYYALQGKDAIDQLPEYEKKMQDVRQSTREDLGNERQRKMFDEISRRRIESELDSMSRHAERENRVWRAQTHEATLLNLAADAADKFNDERAFAGALRSGLSEVDRYTTAIGASAEVTRAQGEKFVSTAWSQRIQRAMLYDPLGARELYGAHSSEIAAADRPVLEHKLKIAAQPVEARIAVDKIMTGADLQELQRALETKDGSFLKVAARAASEAPELPTKGKDTRAMLPVWLGQIDAFADKAYPGDVMMRDQMVSIAKGRVQTIVAAQEAIQDQAQRDLIQRIVDKKPAGIEQLLSQPGARDSWNRLDSKAQLGMVHLAGRGEGDQVKTNPAVMRDVFQRIHADESDPNKITSVTELAQYFGKGLSFHDYNALKREYVEAQTPEGNAFRKSVQGARETAHRMLRSSIMGQIQPEVAEEASHRFGVYLEEQIARMRSEKKDPRTLLTPGSPDYVLAPERVGTFMPNTPAPKPGAAKPAEAPRVADEPAYNALPKGSVYIDARDGKRKVKG